MGEIMREGVSKGVDREREWWVFMCRWSMGLRERVGGRDRERGLGVRV